MKKKNRVKSLLLLCLIMFATGFIAGQFVHIKAFDNYNLIDAMRRPGSNNYRR